MDLATKSCVDCGGYTPFISKEFEVPLCRDCWDIRKGYDMENDPEGTIQKIQANMDENDGK